MQSFLCNPWENSEDSSLQGTAANFTDNISQGDLILLGAGSGSGPGDWGFISPVDPTGPPRAASKAELQDYWAAVNQPNCTNIEVSRLGLYADPGADTGAKSYPGMNVRFDVPNYTAGVSSAGNVRAPVVTDGLVITPGPSDAKCESTKSATPSYNKYSFDPTTSNTETSTCSYGQVTVTGDNTYAKYCGARVDSDVVPSPPTNCKGKNTCTTSAGSSASVCSTLTTGNYRIGSCPLPRDPDMTKDDPSWKFITRGRGATLADLQAYWSNHHSVAFPSISALEGYWNTYESAPFPGKATRYALYLAEVANRGNPGYFDVLGWQPNSIEPVDLTKGAANSCNASTIGEYDRRLINVAIVDCSYWSINGASDRLPVITKNATFFMTEQANTSGEFYGEFIQAYDANQDGGSVFQQVELVK